MPKLQNKGNLFRKNTSDRFWKSTARSSNRWQKMVSDFRSSRQYLRQKPIIRDHGRRVLKFSGLALGYGVLIEPYWVELTSHEIEIPSLSPALNGYRIIHLSDIHHNIATRKKYHERIISKVNSLDPDLIIMTGDFMSYKPAKLAECFEYYKKLNAHDGVYVVRGNHDYHASFEFFSTKCHEAGFHLIENEHQIIQPKRKLWNMDQKHARFVLAGVEDLWEGRIQLRRALKDAPNDCPRFLLAHHPMTAELIERDMEIDVVFSGHTHGGQIRPFQKVVARFADGPEKYISGWADAPHTRVFTSRGVGTSVFRFRWNCRPEIALHTLISSYH